MAGVTRYRVLYEHMPAAVAVGGVFWWLDGNPAHIAIALAFGWLVDADHLCDYLIWAWLSQQRLAVRDFLGGRYFAESGKVIVPLHGFEWCLALAGSSLLLPESTVLMALTAAIALAVHLLQDQWTYRPARAGYFLTARLIHRFDQAWFCRQLTHDVR